MILRLTALLGIVCTLTTSTSLSGSGSGDEAFLESGASGQPLERKSISCMCSMKLNHIFNFLV